MTLFPRKKCRFGRAGSRCVDLCRLNSNLAMSVLPAEYLTSSNPELALIPLPTESAGRHMEGMLLACRDDGESGNGRHSAADSRAQPLADGNREGSAACHGPPLPALRPAPCARLQWEVGSCGAAAGRGRRGAGRCRPGSHWRRRRRRRRSARGTAALRDSSPAASSGAARAATQRHQVRVRNGV